MNPAGYRRADDTAGMPPPHPPPLIPAFGPLQGVRVVDSGRFVAGPWAATYLGEFGAEVIHIEGPPFGPPYADPTRLLPPLLPDGATESDGVSESWVQYSRNKLSVGLDLRTPEGVELFLQLLARSDIWIESSRPGTYSRLGLSDDVVRSANPRLTVVHVSGFGQTGDPARVGAPSYDLIGQAYSGYLSLQGEPDPSPPMRSGTALNDTVTGLAAAAAALMGYSHATTTGRGQSVDVAQFEVFFGLLENLALDYFMRGVVRGRHGRAHPRLHPYDVYRSKDGWVVVAAPTGDSWQRLRAWVGIDDPQWDDRGRRAAGREEIDRRIEQFCSSRTSLELERSGRAADVAVSSVRSIEDLAHERHYQERGLFLEWEDPVAGPVKGAGIVPKFSGTPGGVWRGAPWLGQDNALVLSTLLGVSEDRLDGLRRRGVVGERGPPDRSHPPTPFFRKEGG